MNFIIYWSSWFQTDIYLWSLRWIPKFKRGTCSVIPLYFPILSVLTSQLPSQCKSLFQIIKWLYKILWMHTYIQTLDRNHKERIHVNVRRNPILLSIKGNYMKIFHKKCVDMDTKIAIELTQVFWFHFLFCITKNIDLFNISFAEETTQNEGLRRVRCYILIDVLNCRLRSLSIFVFLFAQTMMPAGTFCIPH